MRFKRKRGRGKKIMENMEEMEKKKGSRLLSDVCTEKINS
jgi:hypothetical protein